MRGVCPLSLRSRPSARTRRRPVFPSAPCHASPARLCNCKPRSAQAQENARSDSLCGWWRLGIVEVGAGTGYWSWLLRSMGLDVVALDRSPVPVHVCEMCIIIQTLAHTNTERPSLAHAQQNKLACIMHARKHTGRWAPRLAQHIGHDGWPGAPNQSGERGGAGGELQQQRGGRAGKCDGRK